MERLLKENEIGANKLLLLKHTQTITLLIRQLFEQNDDTYGSHPTTQFQQNTKYDQRDVSRKNVSLHNIETNHKPTSTLTFSYVTVASRFRLVLYGPFCHGALKLDISTLFTTFVFEHLFNLYCTVEVVLNHNK